jgi:hypothetical protein
MLNLLAALMLVDAGLALLLEERIGRRLPGVPVRRFALIEAALALALIAWSFARRG